MARLGLDPLRLPPEPWVSCILPTFDRRRFLPLSLACFGRQDYANRELIVVDDGSDPVDDLMPDDHGVKYIRLSRRATIGAKRNLAADVARGEILMQWDDDDWFGPSRIREQVGPLATGEADLSHLEQRWLLDARSGRFWYRLDESNPDVRVASGTLAMTKAAWSRAGGYADSSDAEDWELFKRALGGGARVALVPHDGSYVYVRHGGNSYRILVDQGLPPTGWVVHAPPPTIPAEDVAFYDSLARPSGGARGVATSPRPEHRPSAPQHCAPSVDMAIMHHANQPIITNGYADHEGLSELVEAFSAVLQLHARYKVPANLHLSGTLIEAIAWHRPSFFELVRELQEGQLVELVGSAYGQNVMPLFSREHNRRALVEVFELYERHLGVQAEEVRGFWVPERVWDDETFLELLTDRTLPNGGYSWVLLDDRVRFPMSPESSDPDRRQFDSVVDRWVSAGLDGLNDPEALMAMQACSPFRTRWREDGLPLTIVPMFGPFRYWIPPHDRRRWNVLAQGLQRLSQLRVPLAVFGDDLERTAGVGPWCGGRPGAVLAAFELFLSAVSCNELPVRSVTISEQLRRTPSPLASSPERGTFVELARDMGAGEDYRAWSDASDWEVGRHHLERTGDVLRGRVGGLWELAWKQLLASSYETAWRDWDGIRYRPTPWAKAHASHSRSALVAAAAAQWREDGRDSAWVGLCDIDEDGHEELVLANGRLFAVVTPQYGGRLVALFDLVTSNGGALVVGNPADHWNLQEELNRFMEVPRSHPGGFCDVGFENDRYVVVATAREGRKGTALLRNVERGSRMFGATKQFSLDAQEAALEVTYWLPGTIEVADVEFALSPDYLGLLRGGGSGLKRVGGSNRRGWRLGDCGVWVRADPDGGPEQWREDLHGCPHAIVIAYGGHGPGFGVCVGLGT